MHRKSAKKKIGTDWLNVFDAAISTAPYAKTEYAARLKPLQ